MSLLIAVKSCQADQDRGLHDAIRSTWGVSAKALGIEVRFFVAASFTAHQSDEIHLKCQDDYESLPFKTREICRWAFGKMFSHIFLCDTDTVVSPRKLLASGFEKFDYAGKIDRPLGVTFRYETISRQGVKELHPNCYPWASGGYGYFLSRKAFTMVTSEYPTTWAEDFWVSQILSPFIASGEITALNMPRGTCSDHYPNGADPNKLISWIKETSARIK
jgi:hypothetical protein